MNAAGEIQADVTQEARARGWAVAVLLGIGVLGWLTIGRGIVDWNNQVAPLLCAVVIAALMLVPAARRMAIEGLRGVRRKLENRAGVTAIAVAIISAGYFAFTAYHQGRYLHPHWHDELSYVIQMRMLAEGKLWMPAHPVGEFFETFYLLTDHVYASIYFPGTALLYVTEIWLHLPLVTLPICAAGAAVGLTYWILAKLVDPVSALAAAMLMIATPMVRVMSVMVMSNVPVLLMGLLLTVSWMKWRSQGKLRWAALMGIFAGWAAVCRPLEATCFAIPVGVAVLISIRGWEWRRRIATSALIVAAAAPFLILQVVMNQKITGDWREPAWQYYSERDFPQTTMGFRQFDPAIRPRSRLPQKQVIFDLFVRDVVNGHQPHLILNEWTRWRGPSVVAGTMPYSVLLIFLPVGFLACRGAGRWVAAGVLVCFVILYAISVVFQAYYPIVVIPSVMMLVLLGTKVVSRGRFAEVAWTGLMLWCALMAITALPEAASNLRDRFFEPRLMRQVDEWQESHRGRALVIFRYSPRRNIHEEPVYNAGVAWPDEANVVRAQDLGRENHKLFEYYARTQPDREVWLFDEERREFKRLENVVGLAK